MRVAIPHWQGRIAPVFDVAGSLLLVDVGDGGEQGRMTVEIEGDVPQERARQLAQLGVDLLICGALSWPLELALKTARIEVFPQTCGEVECVLEAFIHGKLSDGSFLMPGCPGRGAGRRRRCRGGVDRKMRGLPHLAGKG